MIVVQKRGLAIFLIILVAGCNSEGENKPGKKDSLETKTEKASRKDTSDKPRVNKIYFEDNKFNILSINEVNELREDGWDVHPKSDFRRDSIIFYNTFIKDTTFTNSSFFKLPIADLYLDMQVPLDIKVPYENSPSVQNRIRIYPALATQASKNELYFLLLGEEGVLNESNEWDLNTILDEKNGFFCIKKGKLVKLSTTEEIGLVKNDILSFRKFWKDKYDFIDTSYSFSVEKYDKMLGKKHLAIDGGKQDKTAGYGIVLYPCLDSNSKKLFFVAKGYKELPNKSGIIIFENKYFYDNMDVCPNICPINGIN